MQKYVLVAPPPLLIILSLMVFSVHSAEETPIFDPEFLKQGSIDTRLPSAFYQADAISSGLKEISVSVNGAEAKQIKLEYISTGSDGKSAPCFTSAILNELNINATGLNKAAFTPANKLAGESCLDINAKWPELHFSYDEGNQNGTLTLPQSAILESNPFTAINPAMWDKGINAVRVNYSGYTYHTSSRGDNQNSTSDSSYLSLNSAVNLGRWRLYSFDTFNKSDGQQWEDNHDRAYGETDIDSLLSTLTMGDVYSYSPGSVMGVIPMKGIALGTNIQMLPGEAFNYTPVIRGVANSNAKVVIRQRGSIIYSKAVPPGAFSITDLTSGQRGADLDVTVEESDGSKQEFSVPYTSLPDMIRPGSWRYNVSAGQYRSSNSLSHSPGLAQASIEYGLNKLTLSNVVLAGEGYQSLAVSSAYDLGFWGSMSLDWAIEKQANYARKDEDDASANQSPGQAVRVLYARQFDSTNTSFQVSAYRFRTPDFQSFSEYADQRWGDSDNNTSHRKNEIELTLNQGLGELGNSYLTVDNQQYYPYDGETQSNQRSITLGFNTQIKMASLGLSASVNQSPGEMTNRQLSLSLSMPLDFGAHHNTSLSLMSNSSKGDNSQMATLSGSELDNTLDYSVSVQRNQGGEYSPGVSANYRTPAASYSASSSFSPDTSQYSLGMSGGVLGYSNGVIFSQNLGDTVNIVEAPDADNVAIDGQPGVRTNKQGKAVVPYVTPYRENTISLNTRTANQNVELVNSGMNVTPTHGAVTVTRFVTRVGRRAMVKLTLENGQNAPFGAYVYQDNVEVGMVASDGMLYLSGVLAKGQTPLLVHWGDKGGEECHFILPPATGKSSDWYQQTQQTCHTGAL